MKCPHCNKASKAKVLESRPHAGQVWRRRQCGSCYKTFVSAEHTSIELRMPNETQSRHRVIDRTPKPEQTDGVIRSAGEHLKHFWR